MARRRSIEVPGLSHGSTPIPIASVVGDVLMSGGISGRALATGQIPESLAEQCTEMSRQRAAGHGRGRRWARRHRQHAVYVVDRSARDTINHEWLAAFPFPESRPARHTLTMPLPEPMLVQCEIFAVMSPEATHES